MKINIIKILTMLVSIVLILSIIIPSISYAEDLGLGNLSDYKNEAKIDKIQTKANLIIGLIRIVGTIVSVVALIIIGIKYMMGSLEEKAEYKKTLKPYLIGAFLVFTVSVLPQLIFDLLEDWH